MPEKKSPAAQSSEAGREESRLAEPARCRETRKEIAVSRTAGTTHRSKTHAQKKTPANLIRKPAGKPFLSATIAPTHRRAQSDVSNVEQPLRMSQKRGRFSDEKRLAAERRQPEPAALDSSRPTGVDHTLKGLGRDGQLSESSSYSSGELNAKTPPAIRAEQFAEPLAGSEYRPAALAYARSQQTGAIGHVSTKHTYGFAQCTTAQHLRSDGGKQKLRPGKKPTPRQGQRQRGAGPLDSARGTGGSDQDSGRLRAGD